MESNNAFSVEAAECPDSMYDDDGRLRRTGTWLTASAHIITAVIGSGVLSLAWAMAQMGWALGIAVLVLFSAITFFTSSLLADCYRSPDPVHGKRNSAYIKMVRANLGGNKVFFCGLVQYANLVGTTIGYTITASISMVAIKRSNCFHKFGHDVPCHSSNNLFMIIFGIVQIILCQIPDFHQLSGLSIIAAFMSFGYAILGVALSIAKIAGGSHPKTYIGVDMTSSSEKLWHIFQAVGNVAFAYSFSNVIVDIQDTLKSSPPENKAMKKAIFTGVSTTTLFYMSCGVLGYAAFGKDAPGNFLTGFGFYEPFWLIDIGNIFIIVHLVGAYQVFCQPIFSLVENSCKKRWPNSTIMAKEYSLCNYKLNLFRVVWRTIYVIFTSVIAMILPFFNNIVGLLGAVSFWPLTVFFPIEMYLARAKIPTFSAIWIALKFLSFACLIVTLLATAGAIQGIVVDLGRYKPFQAVF